MKNKLLILAIAMLALVLCFGACTKKPGPDSPEGEVQITSIEIVSDSVTTEIELDAVPDFSGIKVKVNFSDGTSKEVGYSDVTISPLDTTTAGVKSVTVTYQGKSVKFDVTVVDPDATAYVTAIKIVPESIASVYHLDQLVDTSKLQVEATYSTGKTKMLPAEEYTYSTIDTSQAGEQTFTVTYTSNNQITDSIKITVYPIKSITVIAGTVLNKVNVGDTLDTSAIEVLVEYADDYSETVGAAQLTVGTIDTSSYGQKTLLISYKGIQIEYTVEVVGPVSITVNQGSYPAKIKVFGAYAAPDITGYLTYSDESKKLLSAQDFTVGTLDTATAGQKTLQVTYQGLETSINVEVVGVTAIDVITENFKDETLKGTAYDTSNIRVSVTYTDGTSEPVQADLLTFSAIDENTAGEQTLNITYLDMTVQKTIKVCAVSSIRIEGVAGSVQSGKSIDISNMKVYGVYNDKAETEIELNTGITTNVDELNQDVNSVEDRTLTVTYTGTYGTFTTDWTIYAAAPVLTDITIDNYATEVLLNGTYGKSNVSVYAIYENGTSEKVTDFEMTSVATNVAGDVNFTVTYTEGGVTKEVSATVKVCTVTSIRVERNPNPVQSGNDIVLSGMKVVGVYDDTAQTTVELTEGITTNVNTINKNDVGAKTFTVTYNGEFGTFTADASITLTDPALTGITIETFASEVLLNGDYNKNSVTVNATYGNGTSRTVYAADLTIEIATNVAGNTTLTVTYEGITAEKTVKVCTVTGIVIKGVGVHLPVGEELDISGMEIWGVYNSTQYNEIRLADAIITQTNIESINANTDEDATLEFRVTCTDDVFGELEGTLVISAQEPILERIEITAWNEEVLLNHEFDASSIVVKAYYGNGTSEEVTGFTASTVVTTVAGNKTLVVTYEDKTDEKTVKVCTVTSIRVEKNPNPIQSGNDIVLSGMKVVGVYNDTAQTTVELTAGITTNVNTINKNDVGAKTFTVTYNGEFGTFTTTASITLTDPALTGITIETFASEVVLNGDYNRNSVTVNATYGNSTNRTIYAADLTIAITTNVGGNTTLTVTYTEGGVTKTATAQVKVCTITSIRIEGVAKEIQAGKPIDISGMKVYGSYDTSTPLEVELTSGITTNKDEIVNQVGKKLLTVTYTDEQNNPISVNFLIYASAPEFLGIEIVDWARTIGIGGSYDISTIKVNALYGNGAKVKVTNFTVSAINTSTAGNTTFTVTYTEGGVTKTATAEVQICAVTGIAISGINELVVDKGGVHSTSNIQLIVTFSDGSTRVVSKADGVTVADRLDTSSIGEKSLSVTYKGYTTSLTYLVKDITQIAIFGGIADTLREGYAVDYSQLIIEMIYSDGSRAQKLASQLDNISFTGTGVNSTTFTVTYREEYSATKTLTIITLVRISALNSTVPAIVLQNSSFSYADIKITAVYSNNEIYLVNDANVIFTPAVFDTTKPGAKGVTVEYFGKTTTVNILVQGVQEVIVVEGSILKNIKVGQTLDVSEISVLVIYTDGTYNYANIASPYLRIGTIDTSTAGEKMLSVWYQGVEGKIKVNVIDPSSSMTGLIFGALLPDEIVARESYKNNFKDSTSAYRVGDDNPYYFYLNVIVLNEYDEIVDIPGKTIPTIANIYLVDSNDPEKESLLEEGAERDKYVSFNSALNSYDFTEEAIGKTFRLEIRPANEHSYLDEKDVTKSHTVTVVDGYNIYEAWELNIITNGGGDITRECWGTQNKRDQVQLVTAFLNGKGVTRPANLAGVVLHGNIDLTITDFPEGYFALCMDNDGIEKKLMFEQLGLYNLNLGKSGQSNTFNIYGNYYSIYSYNLPCVAPKGQLNNSDEYSSSSLFKITTSGDAYGNVKTNLQDDDSQNPFRNYVVNIQDIATRDNDPNSNDQSASERHMRGLSCYRFGENVAKLTNVNVDAFMTSLNIGLGNSEVILDKVKFYNAWQTHVYIYNINDFQASHLKMEDEETVDGLFGVNLTAYDSLLGKCGGPVIIAQTVKDQYKANQSTAVDVKLDAKSTIYSYVTGQEAWFVATNQVQLATTLKSMIRPFEKAGKPGFLSEDKIVGVPTVNLVMINMGTTESMGSANTSYNGRFEHGEELGLLMSSSRHKLGNDNPYKNATLDEFIALGTTPTAIAPVFQDGYGAANQDGTGTALYNPYNYPDLLLGKDGPIDASFYASEAKYIGLYHQGMGIVMEYYHD